MALDFNGSSQHLLRASTPVTAVPFTLFGRYRYDTAIADEAEHTILSLTDHDAQQEWTLEIGRTGGTDYGIAMVNSGGTVGFALTSAAPTINTWQNLTGVYSANNSRTVYLNAGSSGTDTTAATPSGISHIYVGATSSSSSIIKRFNGAIADTAIWSVALNSSEIAALNAGFSPALIRPTSLVHYQPLIREINDLRGAAFTNVNTATAFDHPRVIMPSNPCEMAVPSAAVANKRRYTLTTLGVG